VSGLLLTPTQLKGIQALGEKGMNIVAYIQRKKAPAKDPSDPYGDDIVLYEAEVAVKAWLVTKPTERQDMGAGEVRTISTHTLRVPVGTIVKTADRIRVGEETFVVTDATNEQSWPEWTICYLRGYEGENA
jgi:hypothetical protein